MVSFDPKPIPGDWNGTGCHTSFSTKKMRQKGGYEEVRRAVLALEQSHEEHISAYGEGNERRLTGLHETAPIDRFSWGVDNQLAHVCIPRCAPARLRRQARAALAPRAVGLEPPPRCGSASAAPAQVRGARRMRIPHRQAPCEQHGPLRGHLPPLQVHLPRLMGPGWLGFDSACDACEAHFTK